MAEYAWACEITRANQAVIASENPKFDKDKFDEWLEDHDIGYFVRDPSSPFDCQYFSEVVFFEIYLLASGDENALFRRIIRI